MSNYVLRKNELQHHGIPGQKWGIRRFQNPDGTYTTEGKRRRREDNYSEDYKKYRENRRKSLNQLSTREIEELNRREAAVNNYKRNHANAGKKWVDRFGGKLMEQSAQAVAGIAVAAGLAYVKNHWKSFKNMYSWARSL